MISYNWPAIGTKYCRLIEILRKKGEARLTCYHHFWLQSENCMITGPNSFSVPTKLARNTYVPFHQNAAQIKA